MYQFLNELQLPRWFPSIYRVFSVSQATPDNCGLFRKSHSVRILRTRSTEKLLHTCTGTLSLNLKGS